jgi:hypothetical protein
MTKVVVYQYDGDYNVNEEWFTTLTKVFDPIEVPDIVQFREEVRAYNSTLSYGSRQVDRLNFIEQVEEKTLEDMLEIGRTKLLEYKKEADKKKEQADKRKAAKEKTDLEKKKALLEKLKKELESDRPS